MPSAPSGTSSVPLRFLLLMLWSGGPGDRRKVDGANSSGSRPLCFGGRHQSSNYHLGDCELSQVNERRVSRRTPAIGLLTINAVCRRGRGKSWGRTPTIGDGEHNVTAYSTDLTTTPVHRGCDDVDLAYRPCHVPPISVCRPHATARVGCRTVCVVSVTPIK
jgi:hypothetical protein